MDTNASLNICGVSIDPLYGVSFGFRTGGYALGFCTSICAANKSFI